MAAFLQWRRFVFFDKEPLMERGEPAREFRCPGDSAISVCTSGRGSLVLGDIEGNIWFLSRILQFSSFQAYKLRVTHLYQLKQHSILVSVGEDELGINPLVKVWNLEKRDSSGNPLCTRIFSAIPGNKPTEVSCLTVHENLNYMAIGFTDGSVVLKKGDITRDRHSKTDVLPEGTYPITGLGFQQSGKQTHLFVVTTENVKSYNVSVKDFPAVELDNHGCSLHCSALCDPSQDKQLVVAGDDCVYLYQPDERGPCFAFDGQKQIVHCYRGYLLIVSKEKKTSKTDFVGGNEQSSEKQILTIYDLDNKFIAYTAAFDDIVDVLSEWGSLYVLTSDRKISILQEKDTQTKLETSDSEVHFDVETAIKVLRQAGYYRHAVYLADKHSHHEWYLKIQLEDIKNYQEALYYIGKLPFDQAERNMMKYGKTLMHHAPDETTELLKVLCTDYRPSGEPPAEREPVSRYKDKANSEEFISIFANNPRELKNFLEHMIQVQANSPQGVYDTLLELRLQDWAHEEDSQAKKQLQEDVMSLLKSGLFKAVFDKALVLCQMHNFKDGVLYLYEQGRLYQQIMHYHMQNDEYAKVIETCERYGEQEACLWEQALGYFARKEEDCKEYIGSVLRHIDRNNLMPPLLVVQTLAHNSTATLSVIKDYLINKLQQESDHIAEDERKIKQYREETKKIREEIEELKSSAKIFQKPKCSMCNSPLELPSVHFLCGHSFHQHCFESYAEHDSECPTCMPENRKVMDMIHAQEQKQDLHDKFQHQLKCSKDGFSVIADYFGRGVFNKLTLITDPLPGRTATVNIDVGLQRDLLIHTKRTA
ncbi:vacuolar protein sorting-associated protein 11 homolog isoform X2 [Carcharodon carcharias]|uniref:vacuolar protein sorting-associated protein 11 homolog isoform X2 n=1 Tax=Carcharodon carcharias TaxID=13397 RepID=UPI001B7EB0FC|nr:vacuolar protein sorting-associated protein 11 homolog isoform X2 [Carcharodon carcharias]